MRFSLRKRCPTCRHQMAWRERFSFTTLWGTRRINSCPNCRTPLKWKTGPYRLSMGAIISALIVIIVVQFVHGSLQDALRIVYIACLTVSILASLSNELTQIDQPI